jgi:aspartate 1-decarboxylase
LGTRGDLIIVATYADYDDAEARAYKPTIILVGPDNQLKTAAE